MAAPGERLTADVAIESPELALVDPDLRARARRASPGPVETVPGPRVGPPPSASRRSTPPRPAAQVRTPIEDDALGDAIRRLNDLAELEPALQPKRSEKMLSLAFAALAWATLALFVADVQPWRV